MDYRDFDNISQILKERQNELACELQRAAWLRDPSQALATRRGVQLALAAAVVVLVVIVISSAHLFV